MTNAPRAGRIAVTAGYFTGDTAWRSDGRAMEAVLADGNPARVWNSRLGPVLWAWGNLSGWAPPILADRLATCRWLAESARLHAREREGLAGGAA